MPSAPQLQLVRESLEGLLAPDVATAVLMEALEAYGRDLPRDAEQLGEFVRGPLRVALVKRSGDEVADEVEAQIARILGPGVMGTGVRRAEAMSTKRMRSPSASTTVSGSGAGTARIVLVAGSAVLGDRLRVAFGGERLAAATAHDPGTAVQFAHDLNASLVLFDTTDPPTGPVDRFVDAFAMLPSDVVVLVWSSGDPAARQLVEKLEGRRIRVAPLDRREGVEPLLDMLRARQ